MKKIRQDTKELSDKIFLNSTGSSLMPNIVVESMIDYFHQEEQFGGYEFINRNADSLEQFYEETARLSTANLQVLPLQQVQLRLLRKFCRVLYSKKLIAILRRLMIMNVYINRIFATAFLTVPLFSILLSEDA